MVPAFFHSAATLECHTAGMRHDILYHHIICTGTNLNCGCAKARNQDKTFRVNVYNQYQFIQAIGNTSSLYWCFDSLMSKLIDLLKNVSDNCGHERTVAQCWTCARHNAKLELRFKEQFPV